MSKSHSIIALIPARSGSERIPDKNIKKLGVHPLIAYTIEAAKKSGIFSRIVVSTDSKKYAKIAQYYGAEVPFLRPKALSSSISSDIEWITYTIKKLKKDNMQPVEECFALLRPTSPFRKAETIQRAWKLFLRDGKADSLRAVEICSQHPAKMWVVDENTGRMHPVLENPNKKDTPWHSQQLTSLPKIYVQNASLEIAWIRCITEKHSISGDEIMPFLTTDTEGFDLNTPNDWSLVQNLIQKKTLILPHVQENPYGTS